MGVFAEGTLAQFNAAATALAGPIVYALQGDAAAAPGPYVVSAAILAAPGLVWRFDRNTVTQAAFTGAHGAAVLVGDISALRP